MQLYVHVPFCKSKCTYCDFTSYPNCDSKAILGYLKRLICEFEIASKSFSNAKITTVYIGGGTPSMLNVEQIGMIVDSLKQNFNLSDVTEFTIECNPESLTEQKLVAYKSLGINRISLGIQSLNDDNLKAIGRVHDSKTALEKLTLASKHFDNVSCDLILGLPYDSEESVKKQIDTITPFVKHLSMYELMVEEETPLAKMIENGQINVPDDDAVQALFECAIDRARKCGFERYEISNFAKDGYPSLHNMGYWIREEYLGFGASAHSFFKQNGVDVRVSNFCDLKKYISVIDYAKENLQTYFEIECDEFCVLEEQDVLNEQIMLGLRTSQGVKKSLLDSRILKDMQQFFVDKGGCVALNDKGMAVMNSIVVELID